MRYEVQDASGVWHPVDEVSAAAYRLDGVPVRSIEIVTEPSPAEQEAMGINVRYVE